MKHLLAPVSISWASETWPLATTVNDLRDREDDQLVHRKKNDSIVKRTFVDACMDLMDIGAWPLTTTSKYISDRMNLSNSLI